MGLLLKLKNGDTALKSLRYGNDRPGGGDSGQPFIKSPIPDDSKDPSAFDIDGFIRGGVLAPVEAATDVTRLSKYLFNTKNPSGLLFTAKQNTLSRIAPKTETTQGPAYGMGTVNDGIYTPLSTIAQAGVGFLGTHLNKQGLDPTGLFPAGSINKYEDIVYDKNLPEKNTLPDYKLRRIQQERNLPETTPPPTTTPEQAFANFESTGRFTNYGNVTPRASGIEQSYTFGTEEISTPSNVLTNRLLKLWDEKGLNLQNPLNTEKDPILLAYSGGPNSILGIGNTNIKFSTLNNGQIPSRTGVNKFDPYSDVGYLNYGKLWSRGTPVSGITYNTVNIFNKTATKAYIDSFKDTTGLLPNYNIQYNPAISNTEGLGTYQYSDFFNENTDFSDNTLENSAELVNFQPWVYEKPKLYNLKDIEQKLYDSYYRYADLEEEKTFLHPSYARTRKEENILMPDRFNLVRHEDRVNTGDPGRRNGNYYRILDKVNGSNVNSDLDPLDDLNDFVQFRINVLNSEGSTSANMKFRAFIDNMSDSYNSNWNNINYMGVGETFKKYTGFDRSISLGFTIVAMSQAEMFGMYDKLRTLASSVAPKYSEQGYMTGNLVKLTVGDYIWRQPGILESFTFDVPTEASWELKIGEGALVKDELPMMIKVTGFKFTPVYEFKAEYGRNKRFITHRIPTTPPPEPDTPENENNSNLLNTPQGTPVDNGAGGTYYRREGDSFFPNAQGRDIQNLNTPSSPTFKTVQEDGYTKIITSYNN